MSNKRPDSECIEIKKILNYLAKSLSLAQQVLDRRNLELSHEFLELDALGFSVSNNFKIRFSDKADSHSKTAVIPLLSLISFRRYRISELSVEFAVIAEDDSSDKIRGQNRLRLAPLGSQTEHVKPACINFTNSKNIIAEFQIDGQIKETMVL